MGERLAVLQSNKSFWYNPFVVIVSAVLLFFSAQFVGALFTPRIANEILQQFVFITINAIALFGLLALARQVIGFKWRAVGFRKPKLLYLLITPPAFIGYLFVSLSLTLLAQKFIPGFDVEQAQNTGFNDSRTTIELIAAFLSLVVIAPIVEETVFRGVLFKGLRKRVPFWLSAAITSLLFAIVHGQLNVAIDTFALSLLLCYLVEKSGSIWPAILLHAMKNGLAFTLMFILKPG